MARKNRVTIPDGIYHVTARVAHKAMLFQEDEVKERIYVWMRDIAAFSGVEIYAFCIMENHLHLLVHVPRVPERYWLDPTVEPAAYAFGMRPPECRVPRWLPEPVHSIGDSPLSNGDSPRAGRPPLDFMLDDEEMISRLVFLYGAKGANRVAQRWSYLRENGFDTEVDCEKERYCRRMYNISQFVKTLSERIAQRYNAEYGHSGHLWEGRFYSGLVENTSDVLGVVAAYIAYNPVKAHLVGAANKWRFGSYSLACNDSGADGDHARTMYERMLGCAWSEARRRMEAAFADKLPEGMDEETFLKTISADPSERNAYGARSIDGDPTTTQFVDHVDTSRHDSRIDNNADTVNTIVPVLRATQAIKMDLWFMRKGGYIGRGMAFGKKIARQLPPMFPRPGFGSLRQCARLDWRMPSIAA